MSRFSLTSVGDRVTLTIEPDLSTSVSLTRFAEALRATDTYLRALDSNAAPWRYLGGSVAADGSVTVVVGARWTEPEGDET